jgi:penicillin-binding protein activator
MRHNVRALGLISRVSMLVTAMALPVVLSACGGEKAFTKGSYDDPNRVELLDDKFNEADMQQMADTIIKAMVACPYVANAPKPPIVIVEKVQNRTEEHIDTVSMTDKIRTALIQSGKVRFINKQERGTVQDEYDYNASGAVSGPTAKKKGGQIGADYILSGAIATNVQQVGNDKFVYYKLTMNMTNMETTTIDCTQEREVRKQFKRQSVGL